MKNLLQVKSLFGADLSPVVLPVTHQDEEDDARDVDQTSDDNSQLVVGAAAMELLELTLLRGANTFLRLPRPGVDPGI